MQSGIAIPDEVTSEFKALAMKRKYRYMILKTNADHSAVEIEKLGARDEGWDAFKGSMPQDAARWAVYELEFNSKDGRKVSKIIFILFNPDSNTNNTEKFAVACNKDIVKSKLPNINRDFQINRWDDLDEATFIKPFDN